MDWIQHHLLIYYNAWKWHATKTSLLYYFNTSQVFVSCIMLVHTIILFAMGSLICIGLSVQGLCAWHIFRMRNTKNALKKFRTQCAGSLVRLFYHAAGESITPVSMVKLFFFNPHRNFSPLHWKFTSDVYICLCKGEQNCGLGLLLAVKMARDRLKSSEAQHVLLALTLC